MVAIDPLLRIDPAAPPRVVSAAVSAEEAAVAVVSAAAAVEEAAVVASAAAVVAAEAAAVSAEAADKESVFQGALHRSAPSAVFQE